MCSTPNGGFAPTGGVPSRSSTSNGPASPSRKGRGTAGSCFGPSRSRSRSTSSSETSPTSRASGPGREDEEQPVDGVDDVAALAVRGLDLGPGQKWRPDPAEDRVPVPPGDVLDDLGADRADHRDVGLLQAPAHLGEELRVEDLDIVV